MPQNAKIGPAPKPSVLEKLTDAIGRGVVSLGEQPVVRALGAVNAPLEAIDKWTRERVASGTDGRQLSGGEDPVLAAITIPASVGGRTALQIVNAGDKLKEVPYAGKMLEAAADHLSQSAHKWTDVGLMRHLRKFTDETGKYGFLREEIDEALANPKFMDLLRELAGSSNR